MFVTVVVSNVIFVNDPLCTYGQYIKQLDTRISFSSMNNKLYIAIYSCQLARGKTQGKEHLEFIMLRPQFKKNDIKV